VALTVVPVELAERSYEITIGPGVLASSGSALKAAGARRAVIIADSGVLATHAAAIDGSLRHAGISTLTIPVQRGEASKSVSEAARLWEALATANVDRGTHIVAVGGGVGVRVW
jgi:3-dehydroquinate synthetase